MALLAAAALARPAHPATLRVPLDQPDVRTAVGTAASGDTILVSPGTYPGGAFVNGKRLVIASRYLVTGDTTLIAQTILQGDAAGACGGVPGCAGNSVLEFGNNASGSAVIGLTLTHGENGVGSLSTVDITRCRVIANGDGADYSTGAGGTFRANLFANNTDDGIDLNGQMNLAILDNEIRDNADDGVEYRLFTYSGPARQVDIRGNRITGNREDGIQLIDYTGIGNYAIRIEHNLFQTNFDGAGLSAAVAFTPNGETIESLAGAPCTRRVYVIHNTFIGEKNGVVGGANVIALNNIFTGIAGFALKRVNGNSVTSYAQFWGNGTNASESVVDAPHCLLSNPQLSSSGRLTIASPAINAGTAFFQWMGETVLNLPPSGYADSAPDMGAFEMPPNAPPVVSAGPDRTVTLSSDVEEAGVPGAPLLRADAPLAGTMSDDGLPYPSSPSILWTVASGPGPVRFQNPVVTDARATFSVPGSYVLQLTVNDGKLVSSDQVQVTVLAPVNMPPVVNAGPTQTITLPAAAVLDGTVLDDGLPSPPATLTTAWTVTSGPAPVRFENADLADTRATCPVPGLYVLRLMASDGALAVSDTVTLTVLPVPNTPPVVDAGPDRTVMIPSQAILDGTVSDDGLPDPPAGVTTTWTVASGPGPVTFQDSSQVDTWAGFTVAGSYVLKLSASDGGLVASDLVQIVVQPPPPPLECRIAASTDDAEESESGHMVRNGADLDLVYENGNQVVGLRFTNVTVPPGAIVIRAYVQFEADAASSVTTDLILRGEAADDPAGFSIGDFNISSRPRTAASTSWSPPPWTLAGEAAAAQRTPDLGPVVQEIVSRPGWASGNALSLIISGAGHRMARSYEGRPAGAALLHIEYGGLAAQGPSASLPAAALTPPDAAAGEAREARAAAVEPGPGFALGPIRSGPSSGALVVAFSLAGNGAARLELHDVSGRRVVTREVGSLGAGAHAIELSERLPAGLYLVRLTQGERVASRKAVVLR